MTGKLTSNQGIVMGVRVFQNSTLSIISGSNIKKKGSASKCCMLLGKGGLVSDFLIGFLKVNSTE